MNFKIISPTRVEVDGADAGNLVDFIISNQALKREIAQALSDWHGSHVKEDERREKENKDAIKAAEDAASKRALAAEEDCAKRGEAHRHRADELAADIAKAIERFNGNKSEDEALKRKQRKELQDKLAALG